MIFPPTEVANTGIPKKINFLEIFFVFKILYLENLKTFNNEGKYKTNNNGQTKAKA